MTRPIPRQEHLLPANATPLEKALSAAMDPLPRLGPAADAIALFKAFPDDPVLPFLIWEYGLGVLQPYIPDPRRLIREGVIWQRLRGTPAALHMALGWIGVLAEIEEGGRGADWPVYQLGLSGIADRDTLRRLYHLSGLSQPIRCRLGRIYNAEYDRRPIILDAGPHLDFGMLDHASGVWDGESGVQVSFGATIRSHGAAELGNPHSALATIVPVRIHYEDTFILDRSRFGDVFPANHNFVLEGLVAASAARPETINTLKTGRELSRSQLVLDGGNRLDGLNSRLDMPTATVVDRPPRLDAGLARLDTHDIGRRKLRLDCFHERALPAVCRVMPAASVPSLSVSVICSRARRARAERGWRGRWDKRRWREPTVFSRFFIEDAPENPLPESPEESA